MADERSAARDSKLSAREVGILLEQLSAGVSHRAPLDEMFRALADDLSEPRLSAVAKQLAGQLEAGADLETAMAAIENTLPNHLRGALAIGAKTGNLSGVLAGLSKSELARKRMQRGLRAALAYPLFVVTFLTLVLLLMSTLVVPHFRIIYEDFELDLPRATLFMLDLAEVLPTILIVLMVSIFVTLLVGFSIINSRILHWLRTAMPLLGRTWVWSGQHEFATLMSTLTEKEVSLTDALDCTLASLRDRNLAWATEYVHQRCIDGATLSQSLRESIHFDPTLSSLAEWGEANQMLPVAMRQAADTYEQQLQLFIQFLHRVLPPLMLTFVASTMFYVIASLIVPLIDLINGLT